MNKTLSVALSSLLVMGSIGGMAAEPDEAILAGA